MKRVHLESVRHGESGRAIRLEEKTRTKRVGRYPYERERWPGYAWAVCSGL